MKRLHRLLLAWLLLLALPLQGYAGTHMLMCSADAGARVPPCHAQAAAGHAHPQQHDQHGQDDQHGHAKHGCAGCSFVAAIAPGALPPPVLHAPVSSAIPFRSPSLPSADPSLPDRPPRHVHA